MAQRLKEPAGPASIHVVAIQKRVFHERHKETGIEKQKSSVKFGRRYTKDGEWMFIQQHHTAYCAAIVLKTRMPIIVSQNDIGSAIGPVFIARMKEMAEIRVKAQSVEVVSAGFLNPDAGWIVPCIQHRRSEVIRHQPIEAAVAVAQIEIVGIGQTSVRRRLHAGARRGSAAEAHSAGAEGRHSSH